MRFSDRIGATKPKKIYQSDDIDDELRNRLWNKIGIYLSHKEKKGEIFVTYSHIFDEVFKLRNDETGIHLHDKYELLKGKYFRECDWYDVYNLLEFIVNQSGPLMSIAFNKTLEEEKSAYRFVNQKLVPISDETEIETVSAVANLEDRFSGAREHIQQSLILFAQKPNADYSNAIKEAISAVESVAKVISGKDSATLGDAIKILNKQKPMHPAFKTAIEKLYGYTSNEGGIRHGLLNGNSTVDEADAHFMIVVCSAFVNFVVSRYR